MTVDTISLYSFRNYESETFNFCPGVNVVDGDNAQGKTNLLEAVYYLTGARSFRASRDKEMIRHSCPCAGIRARVTSYGQNIDIEAAIYQAKRRCISVNGVAKRRSTELFGILNAVLFCPEDLYIIKDGAAARRKLMDASLCQLRPRYLALLTEYNKLVDHKTRMLKERENKPSIMDTLCEFNQRIARVGAHIISFRAPFVRELARYAIEQHGQISGGKEELCLSYKTVSTIGDPFSPVGELEGLILGHMEAHARAELESCSCLSGPHKDDIEITINGYPARSFASQGQTRTAALSLKLAERELFCRDTGCPPVLLLDDVLSELDPGRQDFVLNRISGGQVIITCCEAGRLSAIKSGRLFSVRNGRIERETTI